MLARPGRWALASRIDDVLPALSPERRRARAAETHGSAIELATGPHATATRAAAELADLRAAARRRPRPARAARRGRGHAPVRAVERRRGLARRALPVDLRLDARARPPRADVRAARPRRRARRRGRGPGAARPARARAAAARAVRATRRSGRAATPAWPRPARRSSARSRASGIPRAVRRLRGVRRGGRRAAPLRRVPRADVPVVGRAAAAALGTIEVRIMDAQTRARDTAALAALVQCLVRLEATEGFASPIAGARPRCSTRTASSPRATGRGPMLIDADARRRLPMAEIAGRRCSTRARRTPRRSAARRSWPSVRALLDDPGDERQRRRGGVARGDPVGDALGTVVEALAADFTGSRATASGLPGAGEQR